MATLTEEEAKSRDFWGLVKKWLAKSKLHHVTFYYKDGTTYTMTAEEYIKYLKGLLVEGMLESHRIIIKRELLQD